MSEPTDEEEKLAERVRDIVFFEKFRPYSHTVSHGVTAIAVDFRTSTPVISKRPQQKPEYRYEVGVTAYSAYGETLEEALTKYAHKRVESAIGRLKRENRFLRSVTVGENDG